MATFTVWKLLAQLHGGRGQEGRGTCDVQRGGHSFPPSCQEDFPVLQPLPSAQGHGESMSLDMLSSLHLWGQAITECQRSLRAFADGPNLHKLMGREVVIVTWDLLLSQAGWWLSPSAAGGPRGTPAFRGQVIYCEGLKPRTSCVHGSPSGV